MYDDSHICLMYIRCGNSLQLFSLPVSAFAGFEFTLTAPISSLNEIQLGVSMHACVSGRILLNIANVLSGAPKL